jgi:8-oxo-dGTP pyrophosphatase MutT (NUDIX family)
MQPTNLESDAFKFYLRTTIKEGWVIKTLDGSYELSMTGKIFANSLDKQTRTVQRQPKLSTLIIVSRHTEKGEEILLQQRLRHPYYGFWGLISGPTSFGEFPETTASQELLKQTGLEATFTVQGFYRQLTRVATADALLEDMLFTVMCADTVKGELSTNWQGGRAQWIAKKDIHTLTPLFEETKQIITDFNNNQIYIKRVVSRKSTDY